MVRGPAELLAATPAQGGTASIIRDLAIAEAALGRDPAGAGEIVTISGPGFPATEMRLSFNPKWVRGNPEAIRTFWDDVAKRIRASRYDSIRGIALECGPRMRQLGLVHDDSVEETVVRRFRQGLRR